MLVPLLSVVVLIFGGLALTQAAQDVKPAGKAEKSEVKGTSSHSAGDSKEHKGAWGPGHSLKAFMKKLGITDEQKKKFKALYVAYRDRTRKARTELMALKDEKHTMLLSGKIDQQKMAQIDDQLVKAKGEFLKEKLKLKRDRLALLTPEQLEKISDWMAEKLFGAKMKGMHRGMMRGGDGKHGGGMMHGMMRDMMHGGDGKHGGMMGRGGMKCKCPMMRGGDGKHGEEE
jgi:Spy/CpxP family protein refolding chaperone